MPISEKLGFFIKGACHPGARRDLMQQAGMNFTREDTPYPFGPDGRLTQRYIDYKELCVDLMKYGIYMMGITPYPRTFVQNGIDPSTEEGLKQVEEVCEFMARDLADYVKGWQITNEMNVFHFRDPLTLPEAHAFILAGLRGVRRGNPGALNGYNTAGTSPDALGIVEALRPYQDLMDYIGVDSYCGTWSDGEIEDIIAEIDRVHELTGLPVIVQEFGFASKGEIFTEDEALAYLRSCGYESREAVIADPTQFLNMIPYRSSVTARTKYEHEWGQNALGQLPHILKKWPGGSKVYRHTPEGQAAFYEKILPLILEHPQVIGALVYCWCDTLCCPCGDPECCCETAWGLTTKQEEPKPAYYAVKKAFGA